MTTFLLILLASAVVIGAFGWISAWGREEQMDELRADHAEEVRDLQSEADEERALREQAQHETAGHLLVIKSLLREGYRVDGVHTTVVDMLVEDSMREAATIELRLVEATWDVEEERAVRARQAAESGLL